MGEVVIQAGVILTGATKFIGRHVLSELRSRGVPVTCLVRPGADVTALHALDIELIEGDLNRPVQLADRLYGRENLIHIPNLASMTDMVTLLKVYEMAQLRRVIFTSSTGIFTKLPARTKPRREAAERAITKSRLSFTVVRPTLVYGGLEDDNVIRLLRFCQRSPVMPIFGSGEARQQPVHVQDLAWAIAEVLGNVKAHRKAYNLGGGQVLSYNALIHLSYRALGRRGVLLHLPTKPTATLVRLAHRSGIRLPLREEQILRLEEDKAFDLSVARADFGYAPRSFEQGVAEEARSLLESFLR